MPRQIVVTGAGQGLGYEITLRHLKMGDRVLALCKSPGTGIDKLCIEHPGLEVRICDVGKDEDVKAAAEPLTAGKTAVDILYNVAGIHSMEDRVPLEETDISRCVETYNVNAAGPLRVCSALLPLMGRGAVIINVSSEAGSISGAWRTQEYGYCMSKAALNMATKLIWNSVKDRGIRVFSIHPGWMKTAMGGKEAAESDNAIMPGVAADGIVNIALSPGGIPEDRLFIWYDGRAMEW